MGADVKSSALYDGNYRYLLLSYCFINTIRFLLQSRHIRICQNLYSKTHPSLQDPHVSETNIKHVFNEMFFILFTKLTCPVQTTSLLLRYTSIQNNLYNNYCTNFTVSGELFLDSHFHALILVCLTFLLFLLFWLWFGLGLFNWKYDTCYRVISRGERDSYCINMSASTTSCRMNIRIDVGQDPKFTYK